MATHTPGPWSVRFENRATYIVTAGNVIVSAIINVPGGDREQDGINEANARLIAAAPDLLTALRELVAAHDSGDGRAMLEAVAHARATIDEATKG
jgi:hypothetical protein